MKVIICLSRTFLLQLQFSILIIFHDNVKKNMHKDMHAFKHMK
jgi:hypothetical protein